MIIDLIDVVSGDQVMRFTSNVVPREGETISKSREQECWKVLNVDYLIKPVSESAKGIGNDYLELVTINVKAT